jgi:hypothetical protein
MDMSDLFTKSWAKFSEDHTYRYFITSRWDKHNCLGFVLLNPSKADGSLITDPTFERCGQRARMLDFSAFSILNLYAHVATDPVDLWKAKDPVGPDNDTVIKQQLEGISTLICGWGRHASRERVLAFNAILKAGYKGAVTALAVNKDGSPKHPLYIGYSLLPQPYNIEDHYAPEKQ